MSATPFRLSYWTEFYWPFVGGIETFSSGFLPRLVEMGYAVSVITSTGSQDLPAHDVRDGVEIHRLPLRDALEKRDVGLLMDTIGQLREIEKAFAPDLVHLNFSGPLAFFNQRTATAAPLLTTIHVAVSELRGGEGTVLGALLERSDWIVANSRAALDDVRAMAPDRAATASMIYHGLDVPDLAGDQPRGGAPTLLCVGRLVPVKGFDVAIRALVKVREAVPEARMVIAGEGEAQSGLEALARELGVDEAVTFVGRVEPADIPALMRSATLVIMPSRWREAFGLVAVEAAFQERVVVGSRVGGIQETVDDGQTGLLVANEDPEAMASAVVGLLNDPQRLAAMGQAARQRAIQLFGIAESVRQYDHLYRRLTAHQD